MLLDGHNGIIVIFLPFFEITSESQLFVDPVLTVTVILLASTIAVIYLYFGRIRRVSKAYEEAKSVVGDIVVSFDKQMRRQEEQLAMATQKAETLAVKTDRLAKRIDDQEGCFTTSLASLSSKVEGFSSIESVKNDLGSIRKQLEELAKAQEELKQRAVGVSDLQIETAIPIKKERALAPLTETELRVLEFIAAEGEKTAPEVKDTIKLTREHTARLMKKLYEGGYLERRSEKTPYTYRVKEEMLKILKKSEAKA